METDSNCTTWDRCKGGMGHFKKIIIWNINSEALVLMNFVSSMDEYFINSLYSGQNLRLTRLTEATHMHPRNQTIWIWQWQIVWNQLNTVPWQIPDVRKGRGCLGKLQALMVELDHAKQTVLF